MKKRRAPLLLRSALIAAVLVLLCCLSTHAASAQRLPANAIPSHYTLTLTPDLKTATFTGVEKIDVVLKQATNSITLNAAELTFESVSIFANGSRQTGTVALDPQKEQATLTFPKAIPAGSAVIEIRFSGILNNELRGFYLSRGEHRNYAVTQFEATDARRGFPCFDEPAFKARFDISLVVDSGDTAISNGQIIHDAAGPGEGKHTLVFSTTPKMSTYLVAFLVGDFECTSGSSDGVAIRACATPDKVSLTPYSLDVAKHVLHYYNNYFGIPYPLKKLDLIAIPDFEAGAMENFGAITYRETDMLLDPKTASIASKREVALVVAHEMAHQWFGDLVTMEWWNNIWLNEGFATWMENKSVAVMHPEWNMDQVVAGDQQTTLNLDAQPTTRAIRAPQANTPDEINQLFDRISYEKAGAVLLMVENYLGEETFRKGVHAYLAAHEYGNATAQDFWNAQTAVSHKPVDKIMESLVTQPGVPIVTFGATAAGKVPAEQRRFFLSPSAQGNDEKWTLPVCFSTAGGGQNCPLLSPTTKALNAPSSGPLFANAGGKGYYRSAYSPAQYAALVSKVETLSPSERISLAGDEWAQVRSNQATVGEYLNLVAALKTDSSAEVLYNVESSMGTIYYQLAANQQERDQLAAWIRREFSPEYEKLGAPAEADSPEKRQLRAHLFGLLGYFGKDSAVIAQAREIAEKYIADPASVDPTLAQTALSVAAQNGDAELFDRLQHVYETSKNPEFQDGALRLLAQFADPALAERALEYAVSGKVRNQDAAFQFAIALQIHATRDRAWTFIKNNWEKIHPLLTTSLGSRLVSSTGQFCSAADRDDVQSFFTTHPVGAADVALKHAVEHIDGCIELRSLQGPNLQKWLAQVRD